METNPSRQHLNRQIEAAKWAQQLIDSPEFSKLVDEMDKEIIRLVQLTEESGFIEKAATSPTVLADNLSFRRGIRYVIDYPRRLLNAGERAQIKLSEWEATEENQDRPTDTE